MQTLHKTYWILSSGPSNDDIFYDVVGWIGKRAWVYDLGSMSENLNFILLNSSNAIS